MQACLVINARAGARPAAPPSRPRARPGRRVLVVRAHSDDEDGPLPIFRLPRPQEPVELPKPKLLGGKTIGEELSIIHGTMAAAEQEAAKNMERHLYSSNWQGDVYIGSRWNVMTIGLGIALLVPILGLLFAWSTYGTLWATSEFYGAL